MYLHLMYLYFINLMYREMITEVDVLMALWQGNHQDGGFGSFFVEHPELNFPNLFVWKQHALLPFHF